MVHIVEQILIHHNFFKNLIINYNQNYKNNINIKIILKNFLIIKNIQLNIKICHTKYIKANKDQNISQNKNNLMK